MILFNLPKLFSPTPHDNLCSSKLAVKERWSKKKKKREVFYQENDKGKKKGLKVADTGCSAAVGIGIIG